MHAGASVASAPSPRRSPLSAVGKVAACSLILSRSLSARYLALCHAAATAAARLGWFLHRPSAGGITHHGVLNGRHAAWLLAVHHAASDQRLTGLEQALQLHHRTPFW